MTLSEDIKKALCRSVDPVAAVQLMDFATEEEARAACEYAIDLVCFQIAALQSDGDSR